MREATKLFVALVAACAIGSVLAQLLGWWAIVLLSAALVGWCALVAIVFWRWPST